MLDVSGMSEDRLDSCSRVENPNDSVNDSKYVVRQLHSSLKIPHIRLALFLR